jgi:hypothetical protein
MKPWMRYRLAHIETEARKLARSGEYSGSGSIPIALLSRGFGEVPKVLVNRWTSSELDRLCEQAFHEKRKATNKTTFLTPAPTMPHLVQTIHR